MADGLQRRHDLTEALMRATAVRQHAEEAWRTAIADAYAADVPRNKILEAAAIYPVEAQEILRDLGTRGARYAAARRLLAERLDADAVVAAARSDGHLGDDGADERSSLVKGENVPVASGNGHRGNRASTPMSIR
jgi:hypothetical protein